MLVTEKQKGAVLVTEEREKSCVSNRRKQNGAVLVTEGNRKELC